jgi:multiple sugar transport system ATP-binding protein
MAQVQYVKASRQYPGNPRKSVDRLDLDIADGEFLVLVGPSGCGKSTALRMLAGLEEVSEGEIRIGGENVSRKAPKDRDIAMVFQNYALYPHMSVAENMGFALKLSGMAKTDRDAKVLEAAKLLDLEQYLGRKPKALSGGQRQRVAMGRAIVRDPAVFLMDEPLSNLDAKLRVETRSNISALQHRLGTTTLYVTHDQVEAMTMGSRVAVLKDGLLQQVDSPRNLYDRPINAFVAAFIGSPSMNLRNADYAHGGVQLGGTVVALDPAAAAVANAAGLRQVTVGVRPESLQLSAESGIKMHVTLVEELGSDVFVYGTLPSDPAVVERPFVVRLDGGVSVRSGDNIQVTAKPGQVHAFDPTTGARLG